MIFNLFKLGGVSLLSEQSLIQELFEYIKEKYFTPQLDDYSKITVSADTITTIVFGLFIGINLAALLTIFNKRVLGDFVRALLSNDCLSPEKAMTLSELGFFKNTAVRGSLKSGVTLRRVVRCREEEEYYKGLANADAASGDDSPAESAPKKQAFRDTGYKIDFENAHFYIPEELKYTADIRFDKKGTNWLSFAAVLVLSFIVVLLVFRYIPNIFRMIDDFVTSFYE